MSPQIFEGRYVIPYMFVVVSSAVSAFEEKNITGYVSKTYGRVAPSLLSIVQDFPSCKKDAVQSKNVKIIMSLIQPSFLFR